MELEARLGRQRSLESEVILIFRRLRVVALACAGFALLAWALRPGAPRSGDTGALRRLQAEVITALAAREPRAIRLAEYNADGFAEVCIVHEYRDAYSSLTERRPDFGLPSSGGPRTEEGQYALAFITRGRAGFVFLPIGGVTVMYEDGCFEIGASLVETNPARPQRSATLRLVGGYREKN